MPLNTACEMWCELDGIPAGLTFGSWGGLAVCTKRPFELFYCVNKKYMDAVNFVLTEDRVSKPHISGGDPSVEVGDLPDAPGRYLVRSGCCCMMAHELNVDPDS